MVSTSKQLDAEMDANMDLIKGHYITKKYFVDSAVRAFIRAHGRPVADDEIIGHLRRLKKSKQTRISKESIDRVLKRHINRLKHSKWRAKRED